MPPFFHSTCDSCFCAVAISTTVYDDNYFYVGAVLEDAHVWGSITKRNDTIFHDNDFEVFLDPDCDGLNYYEFEINALGTIWELSLDKPYSEGGVAHSGHNLPGLISAVFVDGHLNDPSSLPDRGWSVTIGFPLNSTGLGQFGASKIRPGETVWRANFSRVHWDHKVGSDNATGPKFYERVPSRSTPLPQGSNQWHPEKNWVWSQQDEINMHAPATWGWIHFVE